MHHLVPFESTLYRQIIIQKSKHERENQALCWTSELLSSCPWHLSACICPDLCLIQSAADGGEGLLANTHIGTSSSSSHPHVTSHSLQFPSSQPSCMPQSIRHKSSHLPPPLRISPPTPPSSLCTDNSTTYTISTANLTISSGANESSGLNGSSAEQHRCKEDSAFLEEENVRVGLLFASKALVQLMVNPFVGPLTNRYINALSRSSEITVI